MTTQIPKRTDIETEKTVRGENRIINTKINVTLEVKFYGKKYIDRYRALAVHKDRK